MGRKPKIVTRDSPNKENPCCQALNKQKTEIENYIIQLIEAREDFIKTKWAWGIIKAIEPISETKVAKNKKNNFMQGMRSLCYATKKAGRAGCIRKQRLSTR